MRENRALSPIQPVLPAPCSTRHSIYCLLSLQSWSSSATSLPQHFPFQRLQSSALQLSLYHVFQLCPVIPFCGIYILFLKIPESLTPCSGSSSWSTLLEPILIRGISKNNLYFSAWQEFPSLLPPRSVLFLTSPQHRWISAQWSCLTKLETRKTQRKWSYSSQE